MASRRDELNAYTFAKKRLLAAFLQPTPTGTDEGAPRPLRAVLPGVVIGVVIMAGFGAWGMFKPKAPKGWDNVAEKVIIGSESTTRYVVLKTDGQKQLHPVLNLASARLLLDPNAYDIVEVDEETLDSGKIPHGATIGIPYAPDRLPDRAEATTQKTWAVCNQPGDGDTVQKAVFVFSDREKQEVGGENRLRSGEVMYVQDAQGQRFIVDARGTAYPLEADDEGLLYRTLVGRAEPQQVGSDWLRTLHEGAVVKFPTIPGIGQPADVPGSLDAEASRVGMVLKAQSGSGFQHYVVLKDAVRPITPFIADLLLSSKDSLPLDQQGEARPVSPGAIVPDGDFWGEKDWPTQEAHVVDSAETGRDTLCNVLRGVNENGTKLSTWAGQDYPKALPNGATSAYVTPGSGLLFRQVKGNAITSGGVFLATDTGLRYAVQANKDSGQNDAGIGRNDKKKQEQLQDEGNKAQILLGYEKAEPVPVPATWSTFLPTGPRLSTSAARQPQGS